MSNANAPFGFRPSRHIGGGTPGRLGTREYNIADGYASNIFRGDAVKSDGSDRLNVATAGDTLLGVFWGVRYVDLSGNVTWKPNWVASTALLTGTLASALVYDDPNQLFLGQMITSCAAADVGLLANIDTSTGGNATTGISGMAVGAHAGSETTLKILGIPTDLAVRDASGNQALNALGNYAIVEFKIGAHEYGGATGAVEV